MFVLVCCLLFGVWAFVVRCFVVCCSLLCVPRCSSFVVCGLLIVVCCVLLAVCCSLLLFVRCSLFVFSVPLFVVCCMLFGVCCLVCGVPCSLVVVCYFFFDFCFP